MRTQVGAAFILSGIIACSPSDTASDGTGGTPSSGGTRATGGTASTSGGVVSSAGGSVSPSGGSTAVTGGTSPSGGTGAVAATTGGTSSGGTATGGTSGGTPGTGGTQPVTGGTTGAGASGAPSENGGSGGAAACAPPPAAALSGSDAVAGKLITFNDDGGWCWYQDERVIVDPEANRMLIASNATGSGRNGNVEVAIYDLATGGKATVSSLGRLNPDDHNVAALLKLGTDKYLAVYTTHNDDCFSYYNIYEGGKWGAQQKFDWTSQGCPTPNDKTVSYSNLWKMGNKIYNFVRSVETSPNLITSDDGSSWTFAGRLTSTPRVGYVAGYYKYWGNNVDRIDFLATEAHPRDDDTSLYHGYIKDGKTYDSMGKEVDNLMDKQAPEVSKFTKAFATGTTVKGASLTHLWNHDIMRYADGTIVALGQGRADNNTSDPDKRFIYLRFDGTAWKTTYLVKGGNKLYSSEEDYTGLSAIHPNDPNTIYVSTAFDPRDDTTKAAKHEIWRGTTCDGGATFSWTPITQNSTKDQLRPVVPYWDSPKTALLWEVGDYVTAQTYRTQIVGLILDGR